MFHDRQTGWDVPTLRTAIRSQLPLFRALIRGPLLTMVGLLCLGLGMQSRADDFTDAQRAAREGRYADVVSILTKALANGELEDAARALAYSNRGIAYSLTKQYELAVGDLETAIEIDPDHALTQNHLGILVEHVDGDLAAARTWYEKAADSGYAAAMTNLAALLQNGRAGATDSERARSLLESAAEQGYPMAYLPLGQLLRRRGDSEAARAWFERAMAAGVAGGYYELGLLAQRAGDGDGAMAAYSAGASAGDADAQNELGYRYRSGRGVTKDFDAARRWLEAAASQGHVGASNRLAWLLATCPSQNVCDGERALGLARYVVDAQASPGHLDTLAAAYARVGDCERAEATVARALEKLPCGSNRYARYADRLRLYSNAQPYGLRD